MHKLVFLAALAPIAFAATPTWISAQFFGSVPPFSRVTGVAADSSGNTVVTGSISTGQFTADGFIGRYPRQGQDGFYYLSLKDSSVEAVVTDDAGNIYATGSTVSTSFPTTQGAWQTTRGDQNSNFILKIDRDGISCTARCSARPRTSRPHLRRSPSKVTMRKSYGFRTFRVTELALYHSLDKLPEPELATAVVTKLRNPPRCHASWFEAGWKMGV
jgi:hypothetical protein